jgi:hypothetical protein
MTYNIMYISVLFVLAISSLPRCRATVHEVVTSSQNSHHRHLQFSNGNKCGVTGFSVYNSITNMWQPLASVVINGFPHAQLVLEKYDPFLKINTNSCGYVRMCSDWSSIHYWLC